MTSPKCEKFNQSNAAPIRPAPRLNPGVGWYAVLIAAGWFFWADAPTLNERMGYGAVKVYVAQVGYGLIAARALAGLVLRNRSWMWVAYAVLLLAVGPLVVALARLAEGQ